MTISSNIRVYIITYPAFGTWKHRAKPKLKEEQVTLIRAQMKARSESQISSYINKANRQIWFRKLLEYATRDASVIVFLSG